VFAASTIIVGNLMLKWYGLFVALVFSFPSYSSSADSAVKNSANSHTAAQMRSAVEAYEKSDFQRVIQIVRPMAQSGNVSAQYLLGSALANDERPPRKGVEANVWLGKAAAQGYVPAMRDLGHLNLLYVETIDQKKLFIGTTRLLNAVTRNHH
jgi:TPR repeat protein